MGGIVDIIDQAECLESDCVFESYSWYLCFII